MAAVGKGPHFLQENPPADFSGYGPDIYTHIANMDMSDTKTGTCVTEYRPSYAHTVWLEGMNICCHDDYMPNTNCRHQLK